MSEEEAMRMREEDGWMRTVGEMLERAERREREQRLERIARLKYNGVYEMVMTEERPMYLRGKRKQKERRRIARYRCGKENQHWGSEEDRKCRMCGREVELWDTY